MVQNYFIEKNILAGEYSPLVIYPWYRIIIYICFTLNVLKLGARTSLPRLHKAYWLFLAQLALEYKLLIYSLWMLVTDDFTESLIVV